jgi:phosphoglycerate dehydrogenase-like enzyme
VAGYCTEDVAEHALAMILSCARRLHQLDRELRRMKPTAFLINCARGALVDETALLRALDAHLIAGAALDVRVQEPTPPGDPLIGRRDFLVTPRAAALREALAGVAV